MTRSDRIDDDAPGRLAAIARQAAAHAYAPYSAFHVGVALRDASGGIHVGVNIENAAYPLGICAERVALLSWRACGAGAVVDVVIFTDTDTPTPPCGLCREALASWAPEAAVHLACRSGLAGPYRPRSWLPARPSSRFDNGGDR